MDGPIGCALLQGIIDGDLSQFYESEPREAVAWLKDKVYLTPEYKGSHDREYQPDMDRAASATERAVAYWNSGDKDAARECAEEARKHLGCPPI
jgi:hypothetical protein